MDTLAGASASDPAPGDSNLLVSFPWPTPGRARRAVVGRLRSLGDPRPVAHRALSKGMLAARTSLEPHAVLRELRTLHARDPQAFRHTSRWAPVDRWTGPDLEGMKDAVRALRDRIGPHETWRLTIERRPGSALLPESVLGALAPLIEAPVNLSHPDKILLVELFADRVALAVVTRAEILSVAAPGRPRPAASPPAAPPFDPADPDSAKIGRGLALPCRLCEATAGRVRLTRRACWCCERAFCETEHGGTAVGGRGSCIECGHA